MRNLKPVFLHLIIFVVFLPCLVHSQTQLKVRLDGNELSNIRRVVLPSIAYAYHPDEVGRERPGITFSNSESTNLIIKQNVTDNEDLYRWFKEFEGHNGPRRDVVIILPEVPRVHREITWTFFNASPIKYQPTMGERNMIETFELIFEHWERD